jgi:hypothetical protein
VELCIVEHWGKVRHKETGRKGHAIGHYVDGSGQLEIDVAWNGSDDRDFVYVGELVFRVPARTAPLTLAQRVELGLISVLVDPTLLTDGFAYMRPTSELEGYKVYDPRDH